MSPLCHHQIIATRINTHSATSAISARVAGAFVDFDLTAGPSETRSAGAGVTSLAGVGASGAVLTGFVMCAVVKICKTILQQVSLRH